MNFKCKISIVIILLFATVGNAQTYPKYTTTKTNGTTTVKPEPNTDVIPDTPVTDDVIVKEAANEKPVADFNALIKQAQQEYLDQQYDKAQRTYAEALAVCPDEFKHMVYTKRAWSYYAVKDFDKSIEDCTTAIEKTKTPSENILGRIYVLRSLAYKSRNGAGDMERACADHQKARELGVIQGQDLHGYNCNKK